MHLPRSHDLRDGPNLPSLSRIFRRASEVFDVPWSKIRTRRIRDGRVEARFAACYVARQEGYMHRQIGEYLNKHHTTIIHAVQRAGELMDVDPQYRQKVESVEQHVRPHA